ncbi:MAG: hypothetical protein NT128_00190 [Proteobacteria bacterium]|nr:hypothetical protein [Pseudomonadota bacterium]
MLIKNLGQVLILSSALLLSTSVMAIEASEMIDEATSRQLSSSYDFKANSDDTYSSSKSSHFVPYSLPYLGSGAIAVCEDLRQSLNSGALNQDEVNEKLKDAIRSDRKYLVEFLLNLLEGLRPDQNGVNQALVYAAESNKLAILELLLNQPVGKLQPYQKTIEATIEEISKRVSCDELVAKAQLSMKDMLKKSLSRI